MKVKIRKAEKRDLKKIAEMFRIEYIKPPYRDKWIKQTALKKIKQYFNKNATYVAVINNEIVGFIIISTFSYDEGLEGFVTELVISEKFQGKGIGTALMKYFEIYCKKKQIIELGLHVYKQSKAYGFYKRLGYKETGNITLKKKIK